MSRPTRGSQGPLPVRDCHPLRSDFPDGSGWSLTITGLVRVRSPLLTESRLMSFPPVTEMFQFTGFASPTYGFSRRSSLRMGFPHSEIHGSTGARPSPWLIAACYVLHRLSVPRHPPDALIDAWSQQIVSRTEKNPRNRNQRSPRHNLQLRTNPASPRQEDRHGREAQSASVIS